MAKTTPKYKLEHKATGRKWETDDRTEVTNLRARGWTVTAEPEVTAAKAKTGDEPAAPLAGDKAAGYLPAGQPVHPVPRQDTRKGPPP